MCVYVCTCAHAVFVCVCMYVRVHMWCVCGGGGGECMHACVCAFNVCVVLHWCFDKS